MGISEAEFKQLQGNLARNGLGSQVKKQVEPPRFGPKFDSGWEAVYYEKLQMDVIHGVIKMFVYHPFNLLLDAGVKYTPDFLIVQNDGTQIIDEVKGFWRQKDLIRFKLAVATFPCWQFRVVKLSGRVWEYEDYTLKEHNTK